MKFNEKELAKFASSDGACEMKGWMDALIDRGTAVDIMRPLLYWKDVVLFIIIQLVISFYYCARILYFIPHTAEEIIINAIVTRILNVLP